MARQTLQTVQVVEVCGCCDRGRECELVAADRVEGHGVSLLLGWSRPSAFLFFLFFFLSSPLLPFSALAHP